MRVPTVVFVVFLLIGVSCGITLRRTGSRQKMKTSASGLVYRRRQNDTSVSGDVKELSRSTRDHPQSNSTGNHTDRSVTELSDLASLDGHVNEPLPLIGLDSSIFSQTPVEARDDDERIVPLPTISLLLARTRAKPTSTEQPAIGKDVDARSEQRPKYVKNSYKIKKAGLLSSQYRFKENPISSRDQQESPVWKPSPFLEIREEGVWKSGIDHVGGEDKTAPDVVVEDGVWNSSPVDARVESGWKTSPVATVGVEGSVKTPYKLKSTSAKRRRPKSKKKFNDDDGPISVKESKLTALLKKSEFSCKDREGDGYYADVSLNCQVFHYCLSERRHSYLCPKGSSFHQGYLICMPTTKDSICRSSEILSRQLQSRKSKSLYTSEEIDEDAQIARIFSDVYSALSDADHVTSEEVEY